MTNTGTSDSARTIVEYPYNLRAREHMMPGIAGNSRHCGENRGKVSMMGGLSGFQGLRYFGDTRNIVVGGGFQAYSPAAGIRGRTNIYKHKQVLMEISAMSLRFLDPELFHSGAQGVGVEVQYLGSS